MRLEIEMQKRDDIVARADEAYGSRGFAEYTVSKKPCGSYLAARILMIIMYVAVIGGVTTFLAIRFVMGIAIMPIIGWMLVFFTWRYVSVEYKYLVDHATFSVYKVFGGKKETVIAVFQTKDIEAVAPVFTGFSEKADRIVDALPYEGCENAYYACGTDKSGKKTVVFFAGTDNVLSALRYYNGSALSAKK